MDVNQEVKLLCNYLIKKTPSQKTIELYKHACEIKSLHFKSEELKLWKYILKYPIILGPVEAFLALCRPDSTLYKKLLILAAILELRPEYANLYISQNRSFLYVFKIALISIQWIIKIIVGLVIVRVIT